MLLSIRGLRARGVRAVSDGASPAPARVPPVGCRVAREELIARRICGTTPMACERLPISVDADVWRNAGRGGLNPDGRAGGKKGVLPVRRRRRVEGRKWRNWQTRRP